MLHELAGSDTAHEYSLCHGMPTGQGKIAGIKHDHAWVEWSPPQVSGVTFVIDRSNGRNYTGLRDDYYRIGKIDHDEVVRYSRDDAIKMMGKHRHYGPWHRPLNPEDMED